jgi:uncharacterized Tic20 family protein
MAEKKEAAEKPEDSGDEKEAKKSVKAEQPADVQPEQKFEDVSSDSRMMGMLCHLLGLFTCFVGPLIIWLIKKDEDPFVDNQGKEALNFQITVGIAFIVSVLLIPAFCIGVFLGTAVGIADLVFCIVAAAKANSGQAYRYPVSIRFIK